MFMRLLSFALLVGVTLAIRSSDDWVWTSDTLNAHNAYRAKHGSRNLTYSDTVADYAQDWAQTLVNEGRMYHRPNNKYGENIYWHSRTANGVVATNSWYKEIKDYTNYKVDPCFEDCSEGQVNFYDVGHFTQVVWRGTKVVGCGSAYASGRGTYIVCNYNPAGNMMGEFPANVRPVGSRP